MQARIGVPTQACLCCAWVLQEPSSDGALSDYMLKMFHPPLQGNGRSNTWIKNEQKKIVNLGRVVIFALNYFAAQATLTFAMKHFFPDSFGVDHKVAKQRVKVIVFGFDAGGPSEAGHRLDNFR